MAAKINIFHSWLQRQTRGNGRTVLPTTNGTPTTPTTPATTTTTTTAVIVAVVFDVAVYIVRVECSTIADINEILLGKEVIGETDEPKYLSVSNREE